MRKFPPLVALLMLAACGGEEPAREGDGTAPLPETGAEAPAGADDGVTVGSVPGAASETATAREPLSDTDLVTAAAAMTGPITDEVGALAGKVSVELPDGANAWPEALKAETLRLLAGYVDPFKQQALEDLREGFDMIERYQLDLIVDAPVPQDGALQSVLVSYYSYLGGAHGMTEYDALWYDQSADEMIAFEDLFDADDLMTVFQPALDEAIAAERRARTGSAEAPDWIGELELGLPVFVASTVPGKIGGVVFYYAPYSLGPYADGSYIIPLPQSVFRDAVRPAYREAFGGDPVDVPTIDRGE